MRSVPTERTGEAGPAPLVLTRRAWLFMITLPIAVVATAAAGASFLTGRYPQPAGAALFGGLSLSFFVALLHYGRVERAIFHPVEGVTLSRRSLLGRKTTRIALSEVGGVIVERRRVRSTFESAGWSSPRWIDASRPMLTLVDGRRLPIFHLRRGGGFAERVRDRIEGWLDEHRAAGSP
ncbi:MAG: hypothetical protein LWW93_15445 [Hyphomicrobiales bacterium]|nr:hypothetical protein [Hyphomicrobiales bacterium]